MSIEGTTIAIRASDVSGQKTVNIPDVPLKATVGEVLNSIVPKMHLPQNDSEGRSLNYLAHLEREGRHLNSTELVEDVLKPEDKLVLNPDIQAGG